jgi:hypothetical protein
MTAVHVRTLASGMALTITHFADVDLRLGPLALDDESLHG